MSGFGALPIMEPKSSGKSDKNKAKKKKEQNEYHCHGQEELAVCVYTLWDEKGSGERCCLGQGGPL